MNGAGKLGCVECSNGCESIEMLFEYWAELEMLSNATSSDMVGREAKWSSYGRYSSMRGGMGRRRWSNGRNMAWERWVDRHAKAWH